MNRVTRRAIITSYDAEHPQGRTRRDTLVVEEPLEIRIGGLPYTVTMRTPGNDVELAHGLLASEGIIYSREDVSTARYCAGSTIQGPEGEYANTYNVLDVSLAPGVHVPLERFRTTVTTASCGVCGTASIDQLRQHPHVDLHEDATLVTPEAIWQMARTLREAQRTFHTTGALHATALFDAAGELLAVREDVGRHNATDKVVGWAMAQGVRPARGCTLVVSGRTSFELAQKAALAGIPILAGVSAPSSLAVDVAQEMGLTLAGFVREGRMNVYTHGHRIRPAR